MTHPEDEGSVSRWIGELKAGDADAAGPLWERYFERLVRLARHRLRGANRVSAEADEEDAALSAFESLCAGAVQGRFPLLADRDDLWRLLVVITARKVQAHVRRQGRQKRGGGRIRSETDLAFADTPGAVLDEIVASEPTPEFAALVAEQYQSLLDALDDDALRQVAIRRMEGHTNDEIAESLGCARRTVARRLDLIRKTWLACLPWEC
jgi:DNA-directed RNA polymerase specialized sigma24 family protein